jgi:hypothetical protein
MVASCADNRVLVGGFVLAVCCRCNSMSMLSTSFGECQSVIGYLVAKGR